MVKGLGRHTEGTLLESLYEYYTIMSLYKLNRYLKKDKVDILYFGISSEAWMPDSSHSFPSEKS